MAKAASLRKGISLELKGGIYRPLDREKWQDAFGRSFSAFGGIKVSEEILKNIELGFSVDYLHSTQYEWDAYLIPVGISLTNIYRYSQNQSFVPYLGGGVDFVYGYTGACKEAEGDKSTYLKKLGWHGTIGARFLLDNLSPEGSVNFDHKYGVNNSYLVLEAKYLQLFNADYAEEDLPEGKKGTGYLDPKGLWISLGFMVEF